MPKEKSASVKAHSRRKMLVDVENLGYVRNILTFSCVLLYTHIHNVKAVNRRRSILQIAGLGEVIACVSRESILMCTSGSWVSQFTLRLLIRLETFPTMHSAGTTFPRLGKINSRASILLTHDPLARNFREYLTRTLHLVTRKCQPRQSFQQDKATVSKPIKGYQANWCRGNSPTYITSPQVMII